MMLGWVDLGKIKDIKAWLIETRDYEHQAVVFAETRGKAKSAIKYYDDFCDYPFVDIYAKRLKIADGEYRGHYVMDWENSDDRKFLTKNLGWYCLEIDLKDCIKCNSKGFCDYYKDNMIESKMTRKEAIDIIKCAIGEVEWDYPLEYTIAFEKAIEALEAVDKIQKIAEEALNGSDIL